MDPPDGQGTAGSGRAGVVSVCPSPRSLHPLGSSRSLRASTLQPAPEEQTPKFPPCSSPGQTRGTSALQAAERSRASLGMRSPRDARPHIPRDAQPTP